VSPAPGPAGNIEFLVWLQRPQDAAAQLDLDHLIDAALGAAQQLRRAPA
jgi:hypothetical protein